MGIAERDITPYADKACVGQSMTISFGSDGDGKIPQLPCPRLPCPDGPGFELTRT
jgi:hypothetical protein